MLTAKPIDAVPVTSTSFVTIGSPFIPTSDWKSFTCWISATLISAGNLDVTIQHAPDVDPANPSAALWIDLKVFTQWTTTGIKTVSVPDATTPVPLGNWIRVLAKVSAGQYTVTGYFVPKG